MLTEVARDILPKSYLVGVQLDCKSVNRSGVWDIVPLEDSFCGELELI